MTIEQSFLLQILSDHLFQRGTEIPEGLDWTALLALSKKHELSPILYDQCKTAFGAKTEQPAFAALRKQYNLAIRQYLANQSAMKELRERFTEAKIPYFPVKGLTVAQYYPEPAFRTMGDVDLVIRHEDHKRIFAVMEALGYTNTVVSEKELHFRRFSTVFEMQETLIHDHGADGAQLYAYFSKIWDYAVPQDGSSEYRLDANVHFLYLVAHIAKHIKWIGVGFRQFFDLAVLVQRGSALFDWQQIAREAERCGLERFLPVCLTLCAEWFGSLNPLPPAQITEALRRELTEKLFSDGVFGFHNEDNNLHSLQSTLRRSKAPLPLLKLRTLRHLLFPSRRELMVSDKYASLRDRPGLLPLVWCKRLLRASRDKRSGKNAVRILSASRDELRQRQEFLKSLGL